MLQVIKRKFLVIATSLTIVVVGGLALAPMVYAAPSDAATQACAGVTAAAGGSCTSDSSGSDINKLVNTIINLLSWIIGVLAVIILIFGGFKFVISAGDSGRITSARSTIIYALVGLVVVALAQTIVKFVIGQFVK